MIDQAFEVDGAREAGCDPESLRRAFHLLDEWVAAGILPGAAAVVARGGRIAGEAYVGIARRDQGTAVTRDTVFPLASVTKPFTATAVLLLVEQGRFSLDEPLSSLLPEFLRAPETPFARDSVTLRHALSHCSGLPGFAKDNIELRQAHRPLPNFVHSHLRQPLLFAPGTRHYYSNCGINLAAETVGRALAGKLGEECGNPEVGRYHPFVTKSILRPLGLRATGFFPPPAWDDRIARVEGQWNPDPEWGTNSSYYRSLGIPWGGLFGTALEVARFVDIFQPAAAGRQRIGVAPGSDGAQVVSPATAQAMTTVQSDLPDASRHLHPELRDAPLAVERASVPWGLGWEIKGGKQLDRSGDLSSPRTYGHVGASGTMVWGDPATDVTVVLLTNQALASGWMVERPRQALFSAAVCASLR